MNIIKKNLIIKYISSIIISSLFIMIFTACSGTSKPDNKINIVTVIFPQYDFARAVTGENANITMITKPGAEIHGFEPSLSDIRAISNADVFVYNGGESDEWVENIFRSIDTSNMKIVRLMEHAMLLEEEHVASHTHNHDSHIHSHDETSKNHDKCDSYLGIDEHIWTNPKNACLMLEAICSAICEKDPLNSETYKKNSDLYMNQICEIDRRFQHIRDNSDKNMIVVGDRFPYLYLAKEYNLSYKAAFSGCSPETDANPSVIIDIIETIKSNKLTTVIQTELSDGRIAKTISDETNTKIKTLHSCQNISYDDFTAGKTYVDIMNENANTLEEALN